jgi:hypothetical protein
MVSTYEQRSALRRALAYGREELYATSPEFRYAVDTSADYLLTVVAEQAAAAAAIKLEREQRIREAETAAFHWRVPLR